MADTLTVQNLVTNQTSRRTYGSSSFSVSRTGTAEGHGRIDVGTSEETISVPADIGSLGLCLFTNHDTQNYVEVGISTGVYSTMVPPGFTARCYGPASQSTFYVKADTATCDFEYDFWEQ